MELDHDGAKEQPPLFAAGAEDAEGAAVAGVVPVLVGEADAVVVGDVGVAEGVADGAPEADGAAEGAADALAGGVGVPEGFADAVGTSGTQLAPPWCPLDPLPITRRSPGGHAGIASAFAIDDDVDEAAITVANMNAAVRR